MMEDVVTVGLRTIGFVRDHGRQFEAWAETGSEALGRFNTYQAACRAVYEHDIKERQKAAR
jgi:hypothetical protein